MGGWVRGTRWALCIEIIMFSSGALGAVPVGMGDNYWDYLDAGFTWGPL